MTADVRLELLGPARVLMRGRPCVSRASHLRLLSLLGLRAGDRVPSDWLLDVFWPQGAPARAKGTLQTHVSALRRVLGCDVIRGEGYGYRLDTEAVRLDVAELDRAVATAAAARGDHDPERCLTAATAAIRLCRGEPYTELAEDWFAEAERVRLQELRLQAWEWRCEALLSTGRPGQALPELERLVVQEPLRERFWEQLMLARARSGRHAEALEAYQQLRARLGELGLDPGPEAQLLQARILRHEVSGRVRPSGNVPAPPGGFVGRRAELAAVTEQLQRHRLVTLTGTGGAGKTRLALEAARAVSSGYASGSWLVELATVTDPGAVAEQLARSLRVPLAAEPAPAALARALDGDPLLVVLDNCEHVLDGVRELLPGLLGSAGEMTVLATSREPLRLPGEQVVPVPPLPLPRPGAGPPQVRSSDAVRLFLARACLEVSDSGPDLARVSTLCRQLDGLPLALELAAGKVRSYGLDVLTRAGPGTALLTDPTGAPRHRTLAATVSWSYEMLDPEEQRLLRVLSVFTGGFEDDAVVRVGARMSPPLAALPLLGGLVEKSLVVRDRRDQGTTRYRLLETVRQFAADRLRETGEEQTALAAHGGWAAELAEELARRAYQPQRLTRTARLAAEVDNLQAALDRARVLGQQPAVRWLADALALHWQETGHLVARRSMLEVALEAAGEDGEAAADLLSRRAGTSFGLHRDDLGLADAIRAVELVRRQPPSPVGAAALGRLAQLCLLHPGQDPTGALPLLVEALERARSSGAEAVEVDLLSRTGVALTWTGEPERGLATLRQAVGRALQLADPVVSAQAFSQLFDPLYLHPTERREGPLRALEQLQAHVRTDDPALAAYLPTGWLPYVYLQHGRWQQADEAIEAMRRDRLEGYQRTWYLMCRATLDWMRGDLDAAQRSVDAVDVAGVHPRWYHDYFPLRAEVATDRGELAEVRLAADRYLRAAVDPTEEAKKLGVLVPLVRAEVTAALASGADRRHGERAAAAVARMEQILTDHPPPTGGSLAIETHHTHLALARAELSRLGDPDPVRWQESVDRADYVHTRLYARVRLAEAEVRVGDRQAASRLTTAWQEAQAVGALGLCRLAEHLQQTVPGLGGARLGRAAEAARLSG